MLCESSNRVHRPQVAKANNAGSLLLACHLANLLEQNGSFDHFVNHNAGF